MLNCLVQFNLCGPIKWISNQTLSLFTRCPHERNKNVSHFGLLNLFFKACGSIIVSIIIQTCNWCSYFNYIKTFTFHIIGQISYPIIFVFGHGHQRDITYIIVQKDHLKSLFWRKESLTNKWSHLGPYTRMWPVCRLVWSC